MKKNNKTAMAMSVAVLTLVLMGTACNNANNNANSSPSASPSVSASPSPSPSASVPTESEVASPSASPEIIDATGKFVGLQDNHTIEITTDKGPTAFQVSPEISEKVGLWKEETPVKFQYKSEILDANGEKVDQLTILSIDKQ
jgi:hypothetical protein